MRASTHACAVREPHVHTFKQAFGQKWQCSQVALTSCWPGRVQMMHPRTVAALGRSSLQVRCTWTFSRGHWCV